MSALGNWHFFCLLFAKVKKYKSKNINLVCKKEILG